jgi:ABC-type sugar transport system permease subunit
LAGLLVMVMTVIVAMKVFAGPMIMTGGGPSDSTRVLPRFIYQTDLLLPYGGRDGQSAETVAWCRGVVPTPSAAAP